MDHRAVGGLVATFGRGVIKDEAAVRAAIKLPWSNGQTEGQITKLKLVKRQMYGRGKIDLLQARLIGRYHAEVQRKCVRPQSSALLTAIRSPSTRASESRSYGPEASGRRRAQPHQARRRGLIKLVVATDAACGALNSKLSAR